jgi:hypothetical protein
MSRGVYELQGLWHQNLGLPLERMCGTIAFILATCLYALFPICPRPVAGFVRRLIVLRNTRRGVGAALNAPACCGGSQPLCAWSTVRSATLEDQTPVVHFEWRVGRPAAESPPIPACKSPSNGWIGLDLSGETAPSPPISSKLAVRVRPHRQILPFPVLMRLPWAYCTIKVFPSLRVGRGVIRSLAKVLSAFSHELLIPLGN